MVRFGILNSCVKQKLGLQVGTSYKIRCVDLTKEHLGEELEMAVTNMQTLL